MEVGTGIPTRPGLVMDGNNFGDGGGGGGVAIDAGMLSRSVAINCCCEIGE